MSGDERYAALLERPRDYGHDELLAAILEVLLDVRSLLRAAAADRRPA